MQIPKEHGAFEKKTLIVVTDSVQAKMYLALKNKIDQVDVLSSEHPSHENAERASGETPGGAHFAEQSEKLKMESRDKLYHLLSKDLMIRMQNKEFEELVIAAPQEHLEELKEQMHINILKETTAFIPKLLTTEDMLDVVIHAQEALQFPE